jgi:hypothetical protein
VIRALLPRLSAILFVLIFLSVLSLGPKMLNIDGDLPRHLLMGKYILQNRSVPSVEVFIHPYLNQPYTVHEWLTAVLFYLIYANWGLAGLVVFSALLLATTFTLLYRHVSQNLNLRLPVLLLIVWGAGASSVNWAVRPHLVSMFLLGVWLIWADDLRRGKRVPLWLFPIVMLIWSNLHGEFIAGILVLLAYSVGWMLDYVFDRSNTDTVTGKNLWIALLTSSVASLINPGGIGPWVSIVGFVNNQYLMSRMIESNSPNFQNPDLRVLFALLTFSIFMLAVKRTRLSSGQGLLLAGFSAMSLIAIRNIHLYGIVAPFVLAETLDTARSYSFINRFESTLQDMEDQPKSFPWILASVIILTLTIIPSNRMQSLYQFQEPAFPVRAVIWLKNHPPQGNMFNELNWGGYLELYLWPEQRSFIDSVADVTGDVTRKYEAVITLQDGWQEILEQYDVTWAIIPPDWPLAKELIRQGWTTAYQDQTAVILVKK